MRGRRDGAKAEGGSLRRRDEKQTWDAMDVGSASRSADREVMGPRPQRREAH